MNQLPTELLQDIQHFGKSKSILQTEEYLANSYYLLDFAVSFLDIPYIKNKYVRQIIVPQEQGYKCHPDIKRISIIQNASWTKSGIIDFDKRQYTYSAVKRTRITHDLQCWRALYNIVCMLDTNDRDKLMTQLVTFLNYDQEEHIQYSMYEDEYDEENSEDYSL
jgi:hypothetical protein